MHRTIFISFGLGKSLKFTEIFKRGLQEKTDLSIEKRNKIPPSFRNPYSKNYRLIISKYNPTNSLS